MGWVSYLEDVRDRLNDDLFRMKQTLSDAKTTSSTGGDDYVDQSRAIVHACEKFLTEIVGAIDMATDPEVELVGRLREAEAARDRLQIYLNDRDTHIHDLQMKVIDRDDRIAGLEQDLKLALKDARKSNELIAALGQDDSMMGKMLDHYLPPERK